MKLIVYILAICLSAPNIAFSATSDYIENFMELDIEDLLSVETTLASRRIETVKDAASSVTVLSKKQLLNMGITKFDEIFNFIPGMQSAQKVSAISVNSPIVRGIKGTGNEILIMINGNVIDSVNYDSSYLTLGNHNLDNIERIEIIRGPGSTMYGTNAFSSIINLITIQHQNSINVEAGTFDSRKISANLSKDWQDLHIDFFAHKASDNGDRYTGIFDPNGLTDNTRDAQFSHNFYTNIDYKNFNMKFLYNDYERRNFYGANALLNGTIMGKIEYSQLDLMYVYDIMKGLSAEFKAHFSEQDLRARGIFAAKGTGIYVDDHFIAGSISNMNALNLSANFNYDVNVSHKINFGFEYNTDDMPDAGHNSNYDAASGFTSYLGGIVDQLSDEVRFINDRRRTSKGIYIQDYREWSNKVSTTFGIRYDKFSNFGETINPRLAIVRKHDKHNIFKFMYGSAFKSPSRFANWAKGNPQAIGNPDLRPMTIKTYEFAHVYTKGKFQLTSTLYHNSVKNMIERSNQSYENVAQFQNTGIEFESVYNPTQNLTFRGTFSQILNAKTKSGAVVVDKSEDYAAEQIGSLSVNYNQDKWNYNSSAFMRNDTSILPSQGIFAVLNSNIQYHANNNSTFYFTIKNLLDKAYYDPADTVNGLGLDASGSAVRNIPNRGRQILIGLKYKL
ncbi:MAG: outer membrane receptor for ferrienterochelin and colicins [Alphaproteobacteria bacterium]|jgi:outer membrane receptor for ferrienterochelin and colicins